MRATLLTVSLLFAGAVSAADLRDLRLWDGPEATRVVLDVSGSVEHKVFTLENPARVVLDVDGLSSQSLAALRNIAGKGVVQKVRGGPRDDGSVRIVFEIKAPVSTNSFSLEPAGDYGHRLVLDLALLVPKPKSEPTAPAPEAAVIAKAPEAASPPKPEIHYEAKPVVIAIDPGHGGEDPGARGKAGLWEKEVTLAISKRLHRLINEEPGMKAVMTREGDYYVGLRKRVDLARKAQADLFVSVHANAFKDRDMHGTAVYTLSNRGATSEQARWLAHKENSADLVGGIELNDKDDELAQVLIDISQDATMEASFDAGSRILREMGQVNKLQKRQVQQAGFAVLKAPDIPSVLVETAFLTNAQEEKMLRDPEAQERLARAILDGVRGYFKTYRPQQPVMEETQPSNLIKVSADPR